MTSLAALLRKEFSAPTTSTGGLQAYSLEGQAKRTYPESRAALLKPKKQLTSLVPLITKGDLPGHPFRGNQYRTRTARDAESVRLDLVARVRDQELKAKPTSVREIDAYQMMGAAFGDVGTIVHYTEDSVGIVAAVGYQRRLTDFHVGFLGSIRRGEGAKLLSRVEAAADKEGLPVSLMALSGSKPFYEARGYKVTDPIALEMLRMPQPKAQKWSYDHPETCHCCAQNGAMAVLKAAPQSRVRDYVLNRLNPVQSAIHRLLQKWARKWAKKISKGLPVAVAEKGDLPGHPFRGNQHTGGGGVFSRAKISTTGDLGISEVFRHEGDAVGSTFRGKSIWGKGRYFSLSEEDSKSVSANGAVGALVKIPSTLRVAEYDMRWNVDRDRANQDYEKTGDFLLAAEKSGKDISEYAKEAGLDGLIIRSNQLQYGMSQLVVFPHAQGKLGKKVSLSRLTKASTKTAQEILDEIDLHGFSVALMDEMSPRMAKAFKDGGLVAREMVGLENDAREMLALMDEDALAFAQARAAELVGMKRVDGGWVENPNAKWSVSNTTRDGLQRLVTEAIQSGWGPQELTERILDSFFFSDKRAEMIARTELAFAHVQGNLKGWKDTGVVAGKRSILADTHPFEDVCDENEMQGVVPLDEPFQDGSMGPPYHPNCLCDIVPVLDDEMPGYKKLDKGDLPGHPFRGNQHVTGTLEIKETPLKTRYRLNGGLTHLEEVDAARFKEVFEQEHQEALAWNQKRLENLKGVSGPLDAYPEVGISDARGRLGVNDGRHRIALAAERGLRITVAVRLEDVAQVRFKLTQKVDLGLLTKAMGPPYHPNCLCDIVPVLDDEMPGYKKLDKGDLPGHPFRGNQWVDAFGTTDPYLYHISESKDLESFLREGIRPSKDGYAGAGVYLANTPEATQYYTDLKRGTLFRVPKSVLINMYGRYSKDSPEGKLQYDEGTGEVLLTGGKKVPGFLLEVRTQAGFRSLTQVPMKRRKVKTDLGLLVKGQ